MNTYLISYDLGIPETSEDYKKLIAYIKTFSWAKPLYSVWFIKTNKTVSQVRDEIRSETDANDKTLVIDVSRANWATKGVADDVTTWMKSNL